MPVVVMAVMPVVVPRSHAVVCAWFINSDG
jgi:predicted nucleic acid-binding Zn ribbon protein